MKTPLYIILRRYRVLAIALLSFFGVLTWDMWQWYQENVMLLQDNVEGAGVFSSLVLLAAGCLNWGLKNVMKKHPCDDDEDHDQE